MDKQFHFGASEIPQELHEALWAAHDAMIEKKAHIGRLKAGQVDIENEIKAARDELAEAKKSHVAGFAKISEGASAIPADAKKAKSKIAEIGGRIVGLEETLPDFAVAIKAAEQEMLPLRQAVEKARREIVKVFLDQVPKHHSKPNELNTVVDYMENSTKIDLDVAMCLYLAAHDASAGVGPGPFPHQGTSPMQFFQFMSRFFRRPSDDEIAVFRSRFEAVIWGDRVPPEPVAMPDHHKPEDGLGSGVNWDAMRS